MEQATMKRMLQIYCKKHHGGNLCPHCQALYQYALARTANCPRKAEKTFCSTCPIHCYAPQMRAEMRQVMGFSGPRMMLYAPHLTLAHLWDTIKHRRL